MKRGKELYSGKAKSMHLTEDPGRLIMEFRDGMVTAMPIFFSTPVITSH